LIERGKTYRFRILNNHYDNFYRNISFAAYYSTINGTYREINPNISGYDLNKTLIPYTLIGVDSTLMHQPLQNTTQFDIGTA